VSRAGQGRHEFLAEIDLPRAPRAPRWPIIPPARCSTARRSSSQPKALLRRAGLRGEGAVPRGISAAARPAPTTSAAGDRGRLRDRKVANIESADQPDVIATGNIGCITQIAAGTGIPIVHTVELLDWAAGRAQLVAPLEIGQQSGKQCRQLPPLASVE
jgi:glycolate oxidase iron-sulfur subunit